MSPNHAMDSAHTALVIGGNGGIGQALAQRWAESGRFAQVLTTTRRPVSNHNVLRMDLSDEASVRAACSEVRALTANSPLTHIAICTGMLHGAAIHPERRVQDLDAVAFSTIMQANALGPLLAAKHLIPLLPRQVPAHLCAISARVGSISDNRLGGWYSYRCSKAALNQGFQTLAIELRRTHPKTLVSLFHPGTVDTALSQPFQKNVAADRLFSSERAARQLDEVLAQRTHDQRHIFFDWQSLPVPF